MSLPKGSILSLVSNRGIRYQGQLHAINQQEKTVALQNVTVHGTEGRASARGEEEILATDKVFPYIVFRSSDIHSLSMIESKVPVEPQNQPPAAPAIVAAPDAPPEEAVASTGSSAEKAEVPAATENSGGEPVASSQQGNWRTGGGRGGISHPDGRGNPHHFHGGRGRGGGGGGGFRNWGRDEVAGNQEPEKWDSEFDFAASNAKLNKEDIAAQVPVTLKEAEPAYQPSSFFDNLSSGAVSSSRGDSYRERTSNVETFGASAVRSMEPRRGGWGRGGGGYRGGGGGYRGGGGGYRGGRGGGRGRGRSWNSPPVGGLDVYDRMHGSSDGK